MGLVLTASGEGSPAPPPSPESLTRLRRWSREPLVQFLVAGLVVFALYAATHRGASNRVTNRIELTDDDLRQLSVSFVAQGRPAPTPAQMRALIEQRVREEVLYREALALGLDQGDEILKRRMVQKMDFLAEDLSAMREPSDADLRAYFAKQPAQFALPPRLTFRHVYFSPDRRHERTRADAAAALTRFVGKPIGWSGAAANGDPFMFQDLYAARTPQDVANVFGREFADTIFALAPGAWRGPVESGLGWHVVFVESVTAGRVPPYEEVQTDVKAAWTSAEREKMKAKLYADMRARYEVKLPSGWEHYVAPKDSSVEVAP